VYLLPKGEEALPFYGSKGLLAEATSSFSNPI
jgi:hypothetical protein